MTHFVKQQHLTPYTPGQAAALKVLWQSQRRALFSLWKTQIDAVRLAKPVSGMGLPFSNPRVFESQAQNPLLVATLMSELEGRFFHHQTSFETWLWDLIRDVQPNLLYEKLLATLDGHDSSYARRLAALIWEVGSRPSVAAPAGFKTWAYRWRDGIITARGTPRIAPPQAVLLVPGKSRSGWHWSSSSARSACHTRAKAAMPTIEWLLKRYGPNDQLRVVCSGGMVRSPKPESVFLAAELRRQMSSWSPAKRSRVVLHEDPLARHTANNARALARIAVMNGVPVTDTWIVTSPGHYGLVFRTSLRRQWKKYAMAGLLTKDRTDISQKFPVTVAIGNMLPQLPSATRGKVSVLASTALVPSPGNALDP